MILVTGATGKVGGSVLRMLTAAGVRVRALTRHAASAGMRGNVEFVTGDLADGAALAPALESVEAIFLFPATGLDPKAMRVANECGVRRVVVLSSAVLARAAVHTSPIFLKHSAAEIAVRDAGLEWTMLRPDTFAANTLAWAPSIRAESVVRAPFARAHRSAIHEDDIAAVAVAALLENGHAGQIYLLTGPESITQAGQVDAIGAAIGRTVRFVEQTREQAHTEMAKLMPGAAASQLLDYLERSVDVPAHVTDTVERVTGRPARTFLQWTHDHAHDFR